MFTEIRVDNYKCLVNFGLALDELVFLFGGNGSGKSAILEAVEKVRDILGGNIRAADAFPRRTKTRWMSKDEQAFEFKIEDEGLSFLYRLIVSHDSSEKFAARVQLEELFENGNHLFKCDLGEVQLYRDDYSKGPTFRLDWEKSALAAIQPSKDNKKLIRFRERMKRIIILRMDPRFMETTSPAESDRLETSAANFASWYRWLSQEHQDRVISLPSEIRKVIPGFKAFRLVQEGPEHRGLLVGFDQDGVAMEFRFDELSDGQRALIVLYTLIHGTMGLGYCLFMDEPDNYLALPEIQPWLTLVKDESGAGIPQTILISHHPELLDYLGADSGWCLERFQGAIRATRPKFKADEPLRLSERIARGG